MMTLFYSFVCLVAALGGPICFGAASTCSYLGRDFAALGYGLLAFVIGTVCFLSVAIVSAKKRRDGE